MAQQVDLLQEVNQKYVIDACALLDFWGSIKDYRRQYDVEVKTFRTLWDYIASQVENGVILIPEVIYKEVDKTIVKEFHEWLLKHKHTFVNYEDCKDELTAIVKEIDLYTTQKGSLQDAILVAIAKKKDLTVITSEHRDPSLNYKKPMIPNVCKKFDVDWVSLPKFFTREGL